MSTVQNIIDGAVGWSTFNDQDVLASDTELVNLIDLLHKRYFSRGASINPAYFGESSTVSAPGASTPWSAPADASIVFRIEKSDGTKVHVVPQDDQGAEYEPSVYQLGQEFYATGSDPNPASDDLSLYHSKVPTTLTATSDSLDSLWPEHFDGILEVEVAKYLATKDGRTAEAGVLDTVLAAMVEAFDAEVASFNAAAEGRFAT